MEPSSYISGASTDQTKLGPEQLDAIFTALASQTRREMLMQLQGGAASVTEIAASFEISQPAVSKHLRVLEKAGLITRNIDAQKRPAELHPANLAAAVAWLQQFEAFWLGSFDQLDQLLEDI